MSIRREEISKKKALPLWTASLSSRTNLPTVKSDEVPWLISADYICYIFSFLKQTIKNQSKQQNCLFLFVDFISFHFSLTATLTHTLYTTQTITHIQTHACTHPWWHSRSSFCVRWRMGCFRKVFDLTCDWVLVRVRVTIAS